MADKIDKALTEAPRQSVKIPGPEEVKETLIEAQEEMETTPEGVEIQEQEDGSVEINYDPNAAAMEGSDEHYANLAEFLPDDVLGSSISTPAV